MPKQITESAANEVEQWIRDGRFGPAQAALAKWPRNRIPRARLARAAELARRAGLAKLALRWLMPVVRPAGRSVVTPDTAEVVEYAASLIRLGATEEAAELLKPIDLKAHPRAAFEKAAILVSQWRYAESIPLLSDYVRHPAVPPYEKFVAKLNLAAAQAHEHHYREALYLLRDLLHETSTRRWERLLGSAFHLTALCFISEGKLDDAEAFLGHAALRFSDTQSLEHFFLRKWNVVLGLARRGPRAEDLSALDSVRAEAIRIGHWETVRDCDRFRAVFSSDEALLHKVFFGTPHESFRRTLLSDFGKPVTIPERYLWTSEEAPPKQTVETWSGIFSSGTETVTLSLQFRRLLVALSADLYRPVRAAAIFQTLCPGEKYNRTSSHRVHQAIYAWRTWCAKNDLGIEIEEIGGDFRLVLKPGCALILKPSVTVDEVKTENLSLGRLRQRFGEASFTGREASEYLATPSRTTARLLSGAMETGQIAREGKRVKARYRFVK